MNTVNYSSGKNADTSVPVNTLIQRRWSPRAFDPNRNIPHETLLSILEAARWSASAANAQPWSFIVAPRDNQAEFQKLLGILKEGNQTWAQHAAVLLLGVIAKYRREDVLNRHAPHDLGMAMGYMVLQALEHDIYAHMIGGFYGDLARDAYAIPDEYEPFTAIAFGYKTEDLSRLTENHQRSEHATRQRKPLEDFIFNGTWAQTADFLR